MSGSPKQKLETRTGEETGEERELYLRDGRKVVVRDDDLVEIRSESGMVEVRIQLTEQGPVLQMESVRMKIAASEAVEIAAPKVAISGTEVEVSSEDEVKVDAKGEIRIAGKMIYLN